jgi:hypothetical protein
VPEEVLVPFDGPRATIALATHVRSTLLCSSLGALRARKLQDAYFAALPRDHHDTIVALVPGLWVPVELAVAHYCACDALPLTSPEIERIGADVAGRIHHSFIGVIVKISREAGATPWTVFGQAARPDVARRRRRRHEARAEGGSLRVGRHSVRQVPLLQDELRRLSARARGARESKGLCAAGHQVLLGADARLPDVVGLIGPRVGGGG